MLCFDKSCVLQRLVDAFTGLFLVMSTPPFQFRQSGGLLRWMSRLWQIMRMKMRMGSVFVFCSFFKHCRYYFKQACLLIFQVNCHASFSQDTDSLMEWWNTVERESQSDLFTFK